MAATIRALNRILRTDSSSSPDDADSPMELEEFVRRSYRSGNREVSEEESQVLVAAAAFRARFRHPDYDRLRGPMSVVACGLHPFWAAIGLDEFFEVLYCAAKYADFMNEPDDGAAGQVVQ
jgi:hypothetical protein